MLIFAALATACYAAVTYIFWRNIRFVQPWKALFSFTIFPFFTIALVVNIALTNKFAPFILNEMVRSKQIGLTNFEAFLGFLASTPVATMLGYLWYQLFAFLSKQGSLDEM